MEIHQKRPHQRAVSLQREEYKIEIHQKRPHQRAVSLQREEYKIEKLQVNC
jgi:hypothetical protein